MHSIFFDLETTDLNPVGQILNYAFVEVSEDWSVKSKLCGKIKISRLQLPNPHAILASKTDVLLHNQDAVDLEHIALAKIQKYIQDIVEWQETRLIGFNSNKFDVPFLRTSMIRNGLNPYFGGSIKYGDVLHVAKRLLCDNDGFSSLLPKNENGRHILKLETLARTFNLLAADEIQQHESLADVQLTIKLAKLFSKKYDIDVREYCSYELSKKSASVVSVFPFIDETGNKVSDEYCKMALLEQNKTQALWINLKKFEEGLEKKSVSWYNKNTSSFFVKSVLTSDADKKLADAAKSALSHINLKNFWPDKNCDVEQFIFMLPINEISALYDAIWRNDLFLIKETQSKFASQLYLRFLANTADIDQVESQIKKYALYRYGGKLKLDKDNFDVEFQEGVYSDSFHPTYNELIEKIDELSKDEKNTHLMSQLKIFYENSIITKLAEKELKLIVRRKINE